MAYIQLGLVKYPMKFRQLHQAIDIIHTISVLEKEGYAGKLTFSLIDQRLRDNKSKHRISRFFMMELAAQGFLKYTKHSYKTSDGRPVSVYYWKTRKDGRRGVKVFEQAIQRVQEHNNSDNNGDIQN